MSPVAARPDVLIVGAGVVGCALSRELAGRGLRVCVLERGQAGEEASAAAAGLLTPQSDFWAPGPFFDLALESHALYPEWTRALEEETGQSVGYRRAGVLRCALSEADEGELRRYAWQRERGLAAQVWSAATLAERLQGALAPETRAGVFFPDEGFVDPRRLTRALAAAARRRGVEFRTETAARRFSIEDGRCLGVETDDGRLEAGLVVNAAGAWANFDTGLPLPVPVEPVRGQIVELELRREAPAMVLHSETVYVVPRPEGRILLGSTLERVGFRKEVTAGAVQTLISEAARLLPAVREARFASAWAGLRPGTPDGLPLLGACAIERLFFATGHYRYGILLAPITARFLADRLTGAAPRDLAPFAVARFAPGSSRGPARAAAAEVFS